MSILVGLTEEIWYRTFYRNILAKITGDSSDTCFFHSEDEWPPLPTGAHEWRDSLFHLAECVFKAKRHLIIVLDRMTRTNLEMVWIGSCFRTLRNILDERLSNPSLYSLTFIFVGTYDIKSLIPSGESDFYDITHVHLRDFTEEEVKKLTTHLHLPTEELSPIAKYIYDWTEGHPYLTQRLCYHLAESHQSAITNNVVDRIVRLRLCTTQLPLFSKLPKALGDPDLRMWIKRLLRGDKMMFLDDIPALLDLKLMGLIKTDDEAKCTVRNRIYKELLEAALGVEDTRSPVATKTPLTIFYCYAHEDKALRTELAKHLSPLQHLEHIINWYDGEVLAGTVREDKIMTQLNAAHIILLLISPDFVASDYCYSKEMRRAIERHEAKEALVIPIILRPIAWNKLPFAHLQVLPSGGKPVCSPLWANRDEAFYDVVQGILAVVENFFTLGYSQSS